MNNQDRWGCLHNQAHPTSSCSIHKGVLWYATDLSKVEYVREHYIGLGGPVVDLENDAAIARVLQEELSQDPDGEAYRRRVAGPAYSNCSDNEACCRTSSCQYGCGSSYTNNWSVPLEITDEPRLDGAVKKRIHQMDRIPHVPRINNRIPSDEEATSDHQRLHHRLELYGLDEITISGDGNCQFRALSDQLYRSSKHHTEVRQQVVDQLKSHPELYAPYVPMPYHEYLMKISALGEWGDHVTLQAAANWYGIRIFVLTSYKDTCYIEILPRLQKSERVIFLSFWAEVHYNSIYPKGDRAIREPGKWKKWWNLMK